MTRGTGERLYRACQRCRKRKSRCDLNSVGANGRPPCTECFRTGSDCKLAGSRRGGNYSRFRKQRNGNNQPTEGSCPRSPSSRRSAPSLADRANMEATRDGDDDDTICAELKNPFDALQILAKAAVSGQTAPGHRDSVGNTMHSEQDGTQNTVRNGCVKPNIQHYELVANGTLDIEGMSQLLRRYEESYHPFVPLVPKHIFTTLDIDQSSECERFLLTAILVIASRDEPSLEAIHRSCWTYLKKLLLNVLLGLPSTQRIGTVEGLLLLSEWVPYIQEEDCSSLGFEKKIFGGTEDSAAWSLVGQAVRQAYLLRLDRTSFRNETADEPEEITNRKRLVWTFVYLADRQISVRMGQSFWSRGPSLSTKFTTDDFPTLQPKSPAEDDHASVLQATIELTQLLHNVHDILYTSKSRTLEIIRMGDYSRYLDDFLKSLMAWEQFWRSLDISAKLKSTLRLMYEYLCLYVNAFSLQAVISRSSKSQIGIGVKPKSLFPHGVMASPDGRFIFEAIRAATAILSTFPEMDAETHICYLPSRFYLYGIYSAVFLWRAGIFGALDAAVQDKGVDNLVRGFTRVLDTAASSDNHIGGRYSKLLNSLWSPDPQQTSVIAQTVKEKNDNNGNCTVNNTPMLTTRNSLEASQTNVPQSHEEILEETFDPFYGSFSGFEADIFGIVQQDILGFQGPDSNYFL